MTGFKRSVAVLIATLISTGVLAPDKLSPELTDIMEDSGFSAETLTDQYSPESAEPPTATVDQYRGTLPDTSGELDVPLRGVQPQIERYPCAWRSP